MSSAAAAARKGADAHDNVPLVNAQYSPRKGGMFANRKVSTLAKNKDHGEKLGPS